MDKLHTEPVNCKVVMLKILYKLKTLMDERAM